MPNFDKKRHPSRSRIAKMVAIIVRAEVDLELVGERIGKLHVVQGGKHVDWCVMSA